jgi:hypothetical protein
LAYTREMAMAIRQIKHPYPGKFTVDMVEWPDGGISVRTYENEMMGMNETQRVTSMEFLNMVKAKIESFGEKCFVEGVPGDPPQKK